MSRGRPRTAIGTFGEIMFFDRDGRYLAITRFRDLDGRLRRVSATARSRRLAESRLKQRILERTGYGNGGVLGVSSPFGDLVELWLADLELRDIQGNTKQNYRDDLRLHVVPVFEHYTLGEITTGRVEWFLKSERRVSFSRAKHSRTVLNQLFSFALRHDAIPRNPVEGTSPLAHPRNTVEALTIEQVQAIRRAADVWRTAPDVMGPKPDGSVRDIVEVLLGTSMRPGEVLALRRCDIADGPNGMIAHVRGTIAFRNGIGYFRQDHPKTDASVRRVAVPEFAAQVLRDRIATMTPDEAQRTIFANRTGGPLTQANLRRTFREFLEIAGLEDSGITPRWFRRTGATVIARGLGTQAAADHLGHTSTAITEGHYIERDTNVDFATARVLESTLRPYQPDAKLLNRAGPPEVEALIENLDTDR